MSTVTHRLLLLTLGALLTLWAPGMAVEASPAPAAAPAGHYKQIGPGTYLLVLAPGASLLDSVRTFQARTGAASGTVTGVGVTRNNVLGFYQFAEDGTPGRTHAESRVAGAREIVSLTCILTTGLRQDGGGTVPASPHCHIALAGSDARGEVPGGFPVVGGHLIAAEVAVTAELTITVHDTPVTKRPSGEFGGAVIDLAGDPAATALPAAPPD